MYMYVHIALKMFLKPHEFLNFKYSTEKIVITLKD